MSNYTKQIGLYLGADLHSAVLKKSKKLDRKVSEIIRSLLRKWVAGEIEI